MSAEPAAAPPDAERHGLLVRAALVVAGALVALAFAALAAAMLWSLASTASAPPGRRAVGALMALFLLAVTAYGASLVRRGVRGWSRRGTAAIRADAWLRRHGYAASLVAWGVLATGTIWLGGGPTLFFLDGEGEQRLVWYVFLVIAGLPVHVALHELGHAVAAALVGFRFTSLRVGSLVVVREAGRLRARWSPLSVSMLGLQHGVAQGDAALGARTAVHLAAGPAATLLVAAACRAVAAATEPAVTVGSAIAVDVLRAGWWTGAFLGVTNLLPFRTRAGLVTDGARLLGAVLPTSAGMKLLQRATRLSSQGRRPGSWGFSAPALLAAAEATPRARDALRVLALGIALDTGDADTADAIVRAAADTPSKDPLARHELALQAAMIDALRGDAAAARARLAALGPHPLVPDYPKLAEATVLLAGGDAAGARGALQGWRRALAASGLEATLRVGNEWAEERVEARLAATGPSGADAVS